MSRSRLEPWLPLPRLTAPVSNTTAMRPSVLQRGVHVLNPTPVSAGRRGDTQTESLKGVVLISARREVLVPHGIGNHDVKLPQPAAGSLKAGRAMVSPKAISASMSWMKAFMRAMAKVEPLISWP